MRAQYRIIVMFLRFVLLLMIGLSPTTTLSAQSVVSPEAFESLSEGRTLHFTRNGEAFGAEQFFSGRRTLWRYSDNFCEDGAWTAQDELICFSYDSAPGPICWRFLRDGDGYAAVLVENDAETGFRLELDRIDQTPLPCPGPKVGS